MIATKHGSPRAIGLNFLVGGDGASMWSVYVLQPGDWGRRTLPPTEPSAIAAELLDQGLDANFCLLRITRPWTIDDYAIGLEAVADIRNTRRATLRRHVRARRASVEALDAHAIDEFLAIRLSEQPEVLQAAASSWVIETESAVFESVLRCVRARRARRAELSCMVRSYGRSAIQDRARACLRVKPSPQRLGMVEVDIEGLFNLLHAVDFPVDAALTAAADRRQPPVWAARLSLQIGAADDTELERRLSCLRSALEGFGLRECVVEPADLLHGHLRPPADDTGDDAGPVVFARLGTLRLVTSAIGSRGGAFVGSTVSGARRPVLFDPFESSTTDAPGGTLITGARGAGKTLCIQLIMYNAFVTGAAVIDVDLAGDHTLDRLPEIAGHVDVLELSAVRRFQGLLDPLRIGPPDSRERLACELLISVLPHPIPVGWYAEIVEAVRAVVRRGETSCTEIVSELGRGSAAARAACRAIEAQVSHGLPVLAYGWPGQAATDRPPSQVISLRLRDLTSTVSGSSPARDGRVARLVARLLAAYAVHLAGEHHNRRCVLGVDDAGLLLIDHSGRALVDQILLGRNGHVAALLSTRAVQASTWLRDSCGAALCFRAQADDVGAVSRILHSDITGDRLARELIDAPPGRCAMRDFAGRAGPVDIELDADWLQPRRRSL